MRRQRAKGVDALGRSAPHRNTRRDSPRGGRETPRIDSAQSLNDQSLSERSYFPDESSMQSSSLRFIMFGIHRGPRIKNSGAQCTHEHSNHGWGSGLFVEVVVDVLLIGTLSGLKPHSSKEKTGFWGVAAARTLSPGKAMIVRCLTASTVAFVVATQGLSMTVSCLKRSTFRLLFPSTI